MFFFSFLLSDLPVNDTEEVGPLLSVNISDPDVGKWLLQDLETLSKYKFYLRACTRLGCGPATTEEGTTTPEARECLSGTWVIHWVV